MVPHASNSAPRVLLRACCARARASCRTARAYSCLRQTSSETSSRSRSHTTRQIRRPFASSAPGLTTASPALPTRPRWLEANASASLSSPSCYYRSYATGANADLPSDIAVLGGGLTGLTTAYYLTRFHPDANVTIYESEARVGGWIDTQQVEVTTSAGAEETISFERGARVVSPQTTLTRYEDFVLYDLVWRPCSNTLVSVWMLT